MNKIKVMNLLFNIIPFKENFNEKVLLYGNSSKHFNKKKNH